MKNASTVTGTNSGRSGFAINGSKPCTEATKRWLVKTSKKGARNDDGHKEAADQFAGETHMVYSAFIDAGFTKNEAFELIKGYISSCGFVCMQQVFNNVQKEKGGF